MQTTEIQKLAVAAAVSNSRRKKKQKEPAFGALAAPSTWLAGLGAAGAGGLGTAYGLGSDKQIQRVIDAANSYDPAVFTEGKLPPNQTGLTYYQKTLSPGAQLKPFGIPVGELLVKLRSSPAIMKALGTAEALLPTLAEQRGINGATHYEMFSRGPIAAYAHQMKAKYPGVKVPETLAGVSEANYTDWMNRKLEDFIASETKQRINPFEINMNFLPHEDQTAMMERFHASLPDAVMQYKKEVENPGPAYASQTRNYLPKAKAYADFRNRLKDTGVTAGGAAVGGGLANAIYNALVAKKKRSSLGQWGSALLGTGLGGAGSYLVGTESGRAISGAWLKNLLDKLSKNT